MAESRSERFVTEEAGRVRSRWEARFSKILTPFEQFVQQATESGFLLMGAALIALILANSGFAHSYHELLHYKFDISFEGSGFNKSLHHWINDGLMALFFFVVGLELKREFLVGELAQPRKAILPIFAAIGGMVVPALVYFALNPEGIAAKGWGIPMATDIAFALGVISILAGRVPKGLITFLVALAIVDDLGAVTVIALFYTANLDWHYLIGAAGFTLLLLFMNLVGIRKAALYFIVGILLWMVFLKSGVHATLAGVITAFMIPAKPKFSPESFSQRMRGLLDKFDREIQAETSILKNQQASGIVQTLEHGVRGVQTPLQKLEHAMHKPVAYFILPIFALFNAGIHIEFDKLATVVSHPVTLGVILGLTVGKIGGIVGFAWLALKLNLCSLPEHTTFRQLVGVGMLGGIGFTMSIFIADLAFASPEMIVQAKIGILVASLMAGVGGYIWLRVAPSAENFEDSKLANST